MNVNTGEFRALTAEVTKLAEAVRHLSMIVIACELGHGDGPEPARAPRARGGGRPAPACRFSLRFVMVLTDSAPKPTRAKAAKK